MPRTPIHHDEKRGELVGTALQLFYSKGYEATSITDIMKAAGISKGALYHYFQSKEEILDAVIDLLTTSDLARFQPIIGDTALTAGEKMIRLLSGGDQKTLDIKEAQSVFRKSPMSLFHYRLREESITETAGVFAEVIKEGVTRGEFKTRYPVEMAEYLAALSVEIAVLVPLRQDADFIERRVLAFLELMALCLGLESGYFSELKEPMCTQISFYLSSLATRNNI